MKHHSKKLAKGIITKKYMYDAGSGFKRGPHCWEARALTTLPLLFARDI